MSPIVNRPPQTAYHGGVIRRSSTEGHGASDGRTGAPAVALRPRARQPREITEEGSRRDQKSGIYVRDLTTGEVRLIRGKQSYLVDPRKEIHITRTLSRDDWNLWIVPGEPHKATHIPITTPWAISIVVPHNTAVLATSAAAQRVIEGPCVALLEYEETLVPLRLSTGTPKDDEDPLVTCYLRTVGNRVSDVVELETADFVRIHVRITCSVTFQREHKERWFNSENYVQVLCDHVRSIVRSRARTLSLSQLWPQISAVVRDTILGPRNEAEGGRKGRFFAENGMNVHEVEVLEAEIQDPVIAEMMRNVQRESVTLTIGDRQAQEALTSVKLRTELERQKLELAALGKEREAKLKELERKLGHDARLSELRDREITLREQLELTVARELLEQRAKLEREKQGALAQAAAPAFLHQGAEFPGARGIDAELDVHHHAVAREDRVLLVVEVGERDQVVLLDDEVRGDELPLLLGHLVRRHLRRALHALLRGDVHHHLFELHRRVLRRERHATRDGAGLRPLRAAGTRRDGRQHHQQRENRAHVSSSR